jgi:DNA invertase Pin-like site-specific DNA recombinase
MSQKALPRSLDALRGLRAARWTRESTTDQYDNFGPDAQRDQQDRAIERYGLIDTGLAWQVAHSGRTVGATPEFAEMLARAGTDYDVLVVGYVSRFARDLRTAANAQHDLHAAGAAILFADERVLTSDPEAWDSWAREAVEAESYSRKLGRRISEGYGSKFRRYADQGGSTPLGFRRGSERPYVLEIDPETIGQAVSLFERYATGTYSFETLAAEVGMADQRVREVLAAPIYNGFARRGRRSREEERVPTAWRANPPVSDELWERVQDVRRLRAHGGGPYRADRVDPLARLIYCVCGRHVKANGVGGTGRLQRDHPAPCAEWGTQRSYKTDTWLLPLAAQVVSVKVDDATMAAVVAELATAAPMGEPLARKRIERRRAKAAQEFAAGRLTLAEFTAQVEVLAAEESALAAEAPAPATVSPAEAVAYLRNLRAAWEAADDQARADLLHAIYARVEVRGPEFVGVTLTPAAEAHGLALALPESVGVARRAGFEPAAWWSEATRSIH